jgi:hypothetical protein
MADNELGIILEPLVRHKVFPTAEEAARALVSNYILQQIDESRAQIALLEKKHGMGFEHFSLYLKQRTAALMEDQSDLPDKHRVAQAIMLEEDDWLEWKIARDTLTEWLGLQVSG